MGSNGPTPCEGLLRAGGDRQSPRGGTEVSVTARVVCTAKSDNGQNSVRNESTGEMETVAVTRLQFQPDYADGRNKEWGAATPALYLDMSVVGPVGDQFELSGKYT